MKKIMITIVSLFASVFFISCSIVPKENGSSGYIEGNIVLLEQNIIGIEGVIYPAGELFPKREKIKCILWETNSKYLLDKYKICNNDSIKFWFIIDKYSDLDWETVIRIGTDLELSSELK